MAGPVTGHPQLIILLLTDGKGSHFRLEISENNPFAWSTNIIQHMAMHFLTHCLHSISLNFDLLLYVLFKFDYQKILNRRSSLLLFNSIDVLQTWTLIYKFYLVSYIITNSAEYSLSQELVIAQEIPRRLWNPKVRYRVHKSPIIGPVLRHMNNNKIHIYYDILVIMPIYSRLWIF
jgi:hypothetical protein